MEQRLIDGLLLWAEIKRLEDLARDRYLDTTSSSPVHTRYCEQLRERTSLKEMVSDMPTIDPIHAAGACYCWECENRNEKYLQGEGNLYCHITHNRVSPTHFCGDGKRGSTNPCDNCMSGSYRGCDGCSYSDNNP